MHLLAQRANSNSSHSPRGHQAYLGSGSTGSATSLPPLSSSKAPRPTTPLANQFKPATSSAGGVGSVCKTIVSSPTEFVRASVIRRIPDPLAKFSSPPLSKISYPLPQYLPSSLSLATLAHAANKLTQPCYPAAAGGPSYPHSSNLLLSTPRGMGISPMIPPFGVLPTLPGLLPSLPLFSPPNAAAAALFPNPLNFHNHQHHHHHHQQLLKFGRCCSSAESWGQSSPTLATI